MIDLDPIMKKIERFKEEKRKELWERLSKMNDEALKKTIQVLEREEIERIEPTPETLYAYLTNKYVLKIYIDEIILEKDKKKVAVIRKELCDKGVCVREFGFETIKTFILFQR